MKYVFLLILSASVIVIARIIILKYKSRVKTGEQFLDFLSFAYSEISYSSMTVNEIVGKFISLSGDAPDLHKLEHRANEVCVLGALGNVAHLLQCADRELANPR